mmetsp:Transcript_16424/g.30988  ORF Transcript_16424/g.30988 Transcript_16424/m.30988 type:complete len:150 (-) Transcript_16424:7-456(-)
MSRKHKFKHQLGSMEDVEFEMLKSDHNKARARLEEILGKEPKFICINDDMGTGQSPPITLRYLRRFYEKYYPSPCPFELPPDAPNPHLHLVALRVNRSVRAVLAAGLVSAAILVIVMALAHFVFPASASLLRLRLQQLCRRMAPRTHAT